MTRPADGPRSEASGWRRAVPDTVGVVWVVLAAMLCLLPALSRGGSLGSFDQLTQTGLTTQSGVVIHNASLIDQITAFIPWTTLAWTQVHHGLLPLWNPYNALGMPLAFNWQSAAFALPSVISYLFPLSLAYTVQVVMTLVIAGTGAYVLGRVLGLGVVAATLSATVFELSGPMTGWLGFPMASVAAWSGWLFAAVLLILRGGRRVLHVVFFAVVLAFMVLAGHPETTGLVLIALGVFLVLVLLGRARRLGGSGPILRPFADVAVAAVAGGALAAPLALPGLQLASRAARGGSSFGSGVPTGTVVNLAFQQFDGTQVAGSRWFPAQLFAGIYPTTACYVGAIALVLAITAAVVRWRRPEVIGLAGAALVSGLLAFATPLVSFTRGWPLISGVGWHYALFPMAFALAVLAGVGLDAVMRSHRGDRVLWVAGAGFAVTAILVGLLWLLGRGQLPSVEARIRAESFVWPVCDTVCGLVVVAALGLARRRRAPGGPPGGPERTGEVGDRQAGPSGTPRTGHRWLTAGRLAGVALLTCETLFLVVAGAPLVSSSPTYLSPTPAEVRLDHAVGSSLVGYGLPDQCVKGARLGILPNVNAVVSVHEFGVYDPIVPVAYYQSWGAVGNGGPGGLWWWYCPSITTASVARTYGVSFVLEPVGKPGPAGSVFDTRVGDEDLYRVPGSAPATITPLAADGSVPATGATGTPVTTTQPNPTTWVVRGSASSPQVLRLRLTNVPGWHATLDGRPLALRPFAAVMIQADLPAGRHTVVLHYWPTAFTVGIALAVLSAVGLVIALVIERTRRQGRSRPVARGVGGP